jgi:hypothetical protein
MIGWAASACPLRTTSAAVGCRGLSCGRPDIARSKQPDACERDLGMTGQLVDDALKHEVDRTRLRDG